MTKAPSAREQSAAARAVVAGSGSSFTVGMRILSAPRRRAIFALYALCRVLDDIVDGPGSAAAKEAELDSWEREIDRIFTAAPETVIGQELADAVERYDLPREEIELILDGMRMDLVPIVGPDAETLERYVRRVAGAVGMLSMRIFGAWRGDPSRRFATSLARAMQFTNILRDVEEDARIGRIYLPRDILEAHALPADPDRITTAAALPHARQALGNRARRAYQAAADEVPLHGRRPLIPALLMMGPYERLLSRMEADWSGPPNRAPGWRKGLDGARCVARAGRA